MNIDISRSVEQGIMRAIKKVGMYTAGGVLCAAGVAAGVQYAHEPVVKTYDAVKNRIETEKAIKAEGIQAKSYAEAKMKLEDIRFKRMCEGLGVPVPKKPSADASFLEKFEYELKVNDICSQATLKQTKELIQSLE